MTRVYLTEPGSTGHKRGGRLEVRREGQVLLTVPLGQIEQLVVVGKGVQLSTALMVDLIGRGVEVAYLSRGGRWYGAAGSGLNGQAVLRAAQYQALSAPQTAARFAQALVIEKLRAQCLHLQEHGGARPAAERIERLLAGELARPQAIDQVRGYEGAAAAGYWQALVREVPPDWGFAGRRHHPAPDALNALLSFGYTLLLQEVSSAVRLVGLDPALGALHTPDTGRPSLALDLEEPFRPMGVDIWVFAAVRSGQFSLSSFVPDDGRVLLAPAARRAFLERYEQAMTRRVRHPLAPGQVTVRQAVELHVRQAAQVFSGRRSQLEAVQWQ